MNRTSIDTISREEIRQKLLKHYGYPEDDRRLVEEKSNSSYKKTGAIFFALNGSPPKGYALYIPEIRRLSLYDSKGKRFRILDETVLEEDSEDTDVNAETDSESEFEQFSEDCEHRVIDEADEPVCAYHDSSIGDCCRMLCPLLEGY